jgi:hypothetical protein
MKLCLTSALVVGIYIGAYAQVDVVKNVTSEPLNKYEVTANNLKSNSGRLLMSFPANTNWTIYIYKMSDGKYVTSYSHTNAPKSLSVAPGEYRITLNNAELLNVAIKKSSDTRLFVGVLNVDINDVWYLYDETGKHYYISGNKPATLLMPVGKYLLKHGDIDKMVVVEETIGKNTERNTIEREKFIMVPIDGPGRLFIPKQHAPSFQINVPIGISTNSEPSTSILTCAIVNTSITCPEIFTIPEGVYKILYGYIPITDVEIRKGYETRLKMGYIKTATKGLFGIQREDLDAIFWFDSQTQAALPWPIGKYQVKAYFVSEPGEQEITDGKTINLNPAPVATPTERQTIITEIVKDKPPGKMGRLFNPAVTSANDTMINSMYVWFPSGGRAKLNPRSSIDLAPTTYSVDFNGHRIKVPIITAKESRPRIGYFKMVQTDVQTWRVCTSTYNSCISFNGPRTVALPVGFYSIQLNARYYLIRIVEDKTLEFAAALEDYPELH